ncbi:BRO-N domain-containing protein [Hirudovirus strain Sangsue]|nr:BRO-N domain-containing protein [Hirudovirus strain Sangsue]
MTKYLESCIDDISEVDSESETEELTPIKKPKAIIKKMVDKDVKNVECDNSIVPKMFNHENVDVTVIMDKNKNYWYKGKDIATLLEYVNSRDALARHVSNEYKKSYADMGVVKNSPLKIDPQTIFIDECGLFQLVSRSKKKEAIKLWKQITKEILPELFATGTYTMPITESDITKLTKNFYNDNILSEYDNQNVIYLAYVGKHEVVVNGTKKIDHVLKFGKTIHISQRDLDEHRKFYETFNIVGIWKTLACDIVEKKIEKNFESNNMLVNLKIKGKNTKTEKNKREHIVLNQINDLDYCLNMIESVINNTKLPQENEYINKIKELENQNKFLIQQNESLLDKINDLKNNIEDLRDNVKILKETNKNDKRNYEKQIKLLEEKSERLCTVKKRK